MLIFPKSTMYINFKLMKSRPLELNSNTQAANECPIKQILANINLSWVLQMVSVKPICTCTGLRSLKIPRPGDGV